MGHRALIALLAARMLAAQDEDPPGSAGPRWRGGVFLDGSRAAVDQADGHRRVRADLDGLSWPAGTLVFPEKMTIAKGFESDWITVKDR